MAYPPRLFVDGYWYHVYTRGQRQEPLYFSPLDRIAYLSFLDRETVFRDVVETKGELPHGENYWGTDEEWAQIDRRQAGREAGKTKEKRGRRTKEAIACEVVEGSDVTIEQLKGQSQNRVITKFRQEAMGRMYEEGYGPTEIGEYFNRTKGSVNHAYRRWTKERNG